MWLIEKNESTYTLINKDSGILIIFSEIEIPHFYSALEQCLELFDEETPYCTMAVKENCQIYLNEEEVRFLLKQLSNCELCKITKTPERMQ